MGSIETKFSVGDVVVRIHRGSQRDFITCTKCSGRGFHLADDGEHVRCSACGWGEHVGRVSVWTPLTWKIDDTAYKIRSVEAKVDSFGKKEVRYPTYDSLDNCSGTMWKEEDCFATKQEALEECSRRNQAEMAEAEERKFLENNKAAKKKK